STLLSIVFIILGVVSFIRLPIAQYPEIVPPINNVSGQYPGANAEVVATTVVAPIEEQINGVENMLYMSSNATADGRFAIAVTFDIGTNLDIAQVQVQNRVGIAQPRLPADVRNIGVTVTKSSPDLMMVVHLYSPDKSRDSLFISNYATLEIKDTLTRVDGVGSITVFGSRDYSMRIWLDPGRLQALGMTATDVTQALQAQNIQVASGVLNQPPVDKPGAFQIAVHTLGRLANADEFANIVVKQTGSAVVRLKDVADIQLAAQDYSSNSYLGSDRAGAVCGVHPVRLHHRHLGAVLPPVRTHHHGRNHRVVHGVADALACAVRAAAESPRPAAPRPLVGSTDPRLLPHFQFRRRQILQLLCVAGPQGRADRRHH